MTLTELLKRKEARHSLLWDEAHRLAQLFQDRGATAVWVFGSLAKGTTTEWSDLDIIVVWPTNLPPMQRSLQLLDGIMPRVAVDLLVFTPDEFAKTDRSPSFEKAVRII